MNEAFSISIYLDTRRAKNTGVFPVKLRVYSPVLGRTKFYRTQFEYSKNDFQSIWETTKTRKEHKEKRYELKALETKANDAAKELGSFSFEQFEKKLFRKGGDGVNVFYQYENAINKLKNNGQIGTASNYELSLKSLKNFIFFNTGSEKQKLFFYEITPLWLNSYEHYMLSLPRSRTTISMYLRALRTIFNTAIDEKEISKEIYPFGAKKYEIPSVSNTKKAFNPEQLKKLFNAKPKTKEQRKALDFWFFSYSCNGMNIKDILQLRFEDLESDSLTFLRAKTINTGKKNLKSVKVFLNDFTNGVIEKYGNKIKSPKQFVFPILSDKQSQIEQHKNTKNFTRFINQNLKKLAKELGITDKISTYWARHSFATFLIKSSGGSMELAKEALGQSSIKTTQNYFAGFEDDEVKNVLQGVMKF